MEQHRCTRTARPFPWVLVLFLCVYVSLTALAVTALVHAPEPSEPLPEPTETIPPEPRHAAVFEELFADPDWERLYALAGVEDTAYEGSRAYAAFMEAKVSSSALTYSEVFCEDPGVRRYLVFLGEEKIAAFTMSGSPQWALDTVELYYEPAVSVTVETRPEYTVCINGVALDDRYTIRTVATKAENYLPDGLHGNRRQWQFIDGLLIAPEVTVLDENGEAVAMELDAQTGTYTLPAEAPAEMTEAEKTAARNAAVADAAFAIGALPSAQLKSYFDENTELYKMLIKNPRNLQKYTSASVDESSIVVSDYCRYSDTLFSANVKLTQKIIRKDGTLKTYKLDKTYFFTHGDSGAYLVTDYTNEHVTETVEQVRLTFATGGEPVSVMVDPADATVSVPEVTVPAGEELVGWATKSNSSGDTVTMTVRILPDGTVLGGLEPMELHPVFQKIQ